MTQRSDMRRSQICHMDVIPYAGSVPCGVVGAEDFQLQAVVIRGQVFSARRTRGEHGDHGAEAVGFDGS